MKYPLLPILLVCLVYACSKGGSEPEPTTNAPTAVNLEYPLKDSECTTGVDQSMEKTSIEFRWKADDNDSYELILENLITNQIQRQPSTNNRVSIVLDKNTPYQWYVVSKVSNSDKSEESEHWKFYSAGDGVSNYAPFPASLISPEEDFQFGKDIEEVTLEWEGSDIDDENLTYDIYIGTENPPSELVVSDLITNNYTTTIEVGKTLFWRITTKDESGNTSNSKVRMFSSDGGTGVLSFEIQQNDSIYTATIDENLKTIKIRLGNFDYEKLAPIINLKQGYSINPESGTEMNFHDSLFYVLTDSKGNETTYTLQVESGQHEVKSFKVHQGEETYVGQIDSKTGEIYLEMGNFDYTDITPEIKLSPKASTEVNQVTSMDIGQNNGATFTVTSEIGTTKEFVVKAPVRASRVTSYFLNPGFEFTDSAIETGYRVFAGSTQYISAQNIQDPSQVILELVNTNGEKFNFPVTEHFYHHYHSFETSQSQNSLTTVIPDDLPSGSYSITISEGTRTTPYPHRFEVINDNRVIRITEINKIDFTRGDTLILKGVNLRKEFAVKSNGSTYLFNDYVNELTINSDSTELRLIFTTNTYNRLKSWTESNRKPLAIQTSIEGYDHKLNSNIAYFNVN
ncbi:hypothetical protein V1387_08610 [Allomuricauda taeanensis]|uniref:hypothetical protein n=1 Tax=Flagellimonas taeanensis TaxID=1005926 RepID=UPI002E7BE5C2|nr:hypothetical protein [Allomuricauda taeanensis]MEE1962742.1 hypothetical protein [Allomuricauda taeanensis]